MMDSSSSISNHNSERATSTAGVVLVLLGRLFFTLIFLTAAPSLFTRSGIDYAAAQGVPLASIGVPLAGVIAAVSGLSVLLGYRARVGLG